MLSKFPGQVLKVAGLFHLMDYVLTYPELKVPVTEEDATPARPPPMANSISAHHLDQALRFMGWASTTVLINVAPNPFKAILVGVVRTCKCGCGCLCARARAARKGQRARSPRHTAHAQRVRGRLGQAARAHLHLDMCSSAQKHPPLRTPWGLFTE